LTITAPTGHSRAADYRWRGLAFAAPDGRDETRVSIVDPTTPPRWTFDVCVDAPDLPGRPLDAATLGAYVDAQGLPPGVTRGARAARSVAGAPAVLVEQQLVGEGTVLLQRQAFVAHGAEVVIATMTMRAGAKREADATFARWLDTLTFDRRTEETR
jgi:hypothetical protein